MLTDGHCDFGHVSGRVACTLPRQDAMSSGSKEAAAGDFIVADFIFDLNYTMYSLFLKATEITHLLNRRVSSKGKGSARFASSSVSSTQSQKSQRDDSDMIKHYLIPLHPVLSETRRLKATDQ